MKILHLNDQHECKGGVEVSIGHLVEELRKRDVGVVSMSVESGLGAGPFSVRTDSDEAIIREDFPRWANLFRRFLKEHDIDLIHVHSMTAPRIIDYCSALRPTIRTMHEPRMFCPGGGKFWRFAEAPCTIPFGAHCLVHAYTQGCCNRHPRRLLHGFRNTTFEIRSAARNYARIIVASRYMRDEAARAGFRRENISVLPNFTSRTPSPGEPSRDPPRLLFVGRFIQHKGVHRMLDAVRPILRSRPSLVLDLVGDGDRYPGMEDAMRRLSADGTDGRVHFHGWKSPAEVARFLERARVVLFPSLYPEAFGIVGIESMMHGRPVVAFDVGGVSEWLEDGVTGFAVPPNNVEAFSRSMETLLDDRALYRRMSEQARASALKDFTAESHMPHLIDIYENALVGPAGVATS